ncbi:MAG: small subunit ribosomal protein [Candidatus Sumerlaeota bacterium]|nr:small subunit ribosomal protein [Candidatus Sumerlaeota bacterium]
MSPDNNPSQDAKEHLEATNPAETPTPHPDSEEHLDAELVQEMEQFDALINQHLPGSAEEQTRGEIIEVPVVAVREDSVLVDIGGKAEASVRIEEFPVVDGKPAVEVGMVIPVLHSGRNNDGTPRVSHRAARERVAEKAIRAAMEQNEPIVGRVSQTVKGGLMVDIGVSAFMPASQVDLFKIPDLTTLVGQEIEAYVTEFDPRRRRAVVSRRQLLVERREQQKREILESLQPGQTITGKVKNALDFGVFLDLGVIDGFVPREEVSWDRGTHPSQIVEVGQEIEVKVVKVDIESGKVTLSRKRMTDDPWEALDDRFEVGKRIKGKVIAIQNYGVFVHIEEGVTGMIHASDLSWTPGNKKPTDFVQNGQEVECQILEINKESKRMSLGLKQLENDPWADARTKYPKKAIIKGTVTSLTNYGAFVRLDEFIEGMIHVSDLSWERRINHPKEMLKVGDEIEVMVLKVDPAQRRISLGIKQIQGSPYDAFMKDHPVGSVVTGKVTRFAPFGAFVEVAPNLEGLIHISQIDEKRVELPENVLSIGEEVSCKIVKAESKSQKISLSRKEALRKIERDSIKAYMRKKDDSGGLNTLGEALNRAKEEADARE